MPAPDFSARLEQHVDTLIVHWGTRDEMRLFEGVKAAIGIARVKLDAALTQTRLVLETIVTDLYQRELPDARPRPLFDMINAISNRAGLLRADTVATMHLIRMGGNRAVHVQGNDAVAATAQEVEATLLLTMNLVEWYLRDYLASDDHQATPSPTTPLVASNPYQGLSAFQIEDADHYFGRETEVADVLEMLQRQPLVAIVGASGSGKSSLALAGVAATLLKTGQWHVLTCRPKLHPFEELAKTLLQKGDQEPDANQIATLAERIQKGEISLFEKIREKSSPANQTKKILLVIDQFEELYTHTTDPKIHNAFVNTILRAVEQAGQHPLSILLNLRADFLGRALEHTGLAAALDRYPKKLLGPVGDERRLRDILEKPIASTGITFEPLLVERILRDLGQLDGATAAENCAPNLPLLQFALSELWKHQSERRLTHIAYTEMGGIQRALSEHADKVLKEFESSGQMMEVRHVLVQMVRVSDDSEDTRQVVTRAQLGDQRWSLIANLASKHLVVTGRGEGATAELIHEALIRHWQPLRVWLREDRAFRLWQNMLRQSLAEWERAQYDDGSLITTRARLKEAEERLLTDRDRLTSTEIAYIRASIKRYERVQRRSFWALAAFLTVSLVLGAVATWQWLVADAQLTEAKHNFGLALNERANQSMEQRDPNATYLYSLHELAWLRADSEERPTAVGRVLETSVVPSTPLVGHAGKVQSVAFSPNGKILASGSGDGSIRLWDVVTGKPLAVLTGYAGIVSGVAFSPDGKTLASGSGDGSIRLWDVATKKLLATLTGNDNGVQSVAFSPDGKILASGYGDRNSTIRLWDVATNKLLATLNGYYNGVQSVAFSPNGKMLASGSGDGIIRLWDVATGKTVETLTGHSNGVQSVAFSPDGKTLASGSGDSTIRLWDVVTGEAPILVANDSGEVQSVAFSLDGKMLAAGSDDETIRLWDVATHQLLAVLTGHSEAVHSIAFSSDGKTLASGSDDKTVRLWEVATDSTLVIPDRQLQSTEIRISFSRDGSRLASRSKDKITGQWMAATGRAEPEGYSPEVTHSTIFATDEKRLSYRLRFDGQHKTTLLYDAMTGKLLTTLDWSSDDVILSPQGTLVASVSGQVIRLLDVSTWHLLAKWEIRPGFVTGIAFSPDEKTLALRSGSGALHLGGVSNIIRLWKIDTLSHIVNGLTTEQIASEEKRLGLHLDGLTLVPIPPAAVSTDEPIHWSTDHPNHWLSAAEAGDADAMIQIGLLYDRSNDNDRALAWYRKAANAGSEEGKKRAAFLEDWIKRNASAQ